MSTKSNSFLFERISQDELNSLVSIRDGETKIGQTIQIDPSIESVQFVIIGIQEHIGPSSNGGFSGAENGYPAFLSRFLNMQSNRFLSGSEIAVYGKIRQLEDFTDIQNGRFLIEQLDDLVTSVIKPIIELGKIPIVIGGGHNNAFPIIRAISEVLNNPMSIINFDPHADCRPLEGRHSGNPFSYAHAGGYLKNYHVIGLHKSYNSEYILNFLTDNNFSFSFFDDYVNGTAKFHEDISTVKKNYSQEKNVGIELDMDSIAFMPSSAFSPSGMRLEDARYYCSEMAKLPTIRYLHLPEGAPTNTLEEKIVGKALAYLVWDFVYTRLKKI